MPPPEPATDLIYRPAKRERVGLIIGLSGPSWSGKTFSALRLARGMAGPTGRIAMLDTERGRGLTYADDFSFDHGELHEPFSPDRYATAAALSKQVGYDVLIIDSMTHEHSGPGGVLEMHEDELNRLTQGSNDFARREAMKMVAWIRPKVAHKAMVQRLLQLNAHLILNFRAEEKTEIQKLPNKAGKLVNTPVNIGFQPITAKDMAYELTIMLGFDPKNPGVPVPVKLADKFKPFVRLDRVLDEEAGARLAAWARGDKPPQESTSTPSLARLGRAQSDAERESPPSEAPGGSETSPPPSESSPREGKEITPSEAPNKNEVAVLAIIQAFDAIQDQAEYWQAIDDAERRKRIAWFKDKKPELHARILAAQDAAGVRAGVKQPAQEPA